MMAREINKLKQPELAKLKAGYHGDGGGLYLQVTPTGSRLWVFRYRIGNNKTREMGLGPLHTVTLAEARRKALNARQKRLDGIDPITAKKPARGSRTFAECATEYIESHKAGWKNPKHADQWTNTLTTYAYPFIGEMLVQNVDIDAVLKCLHLIWNTKTETASRLRGRIESVLSWATVKGYREGDNPARWRGHLDQVLSKPNDVKKVTHFPALPYSKISGFMKKLRKQTEGSMGAICLEFTILCACRSGESRGATWAEFDLDAGLWTIPAERMKAGKEHRVPLSMAALNIVKKLSDAKTSELVFPGMKDGQALSDMSLSAVLRRMEIKNTTVHGFRSTFRDWAGETRHYANEMVELALAHGIKDAAEKAYRRGDMVTKRREMMDDWAGYCAGK